MTMLLLFLAGFFASQVPLDSRELESRARELLERAYAHPDVERWCMRNGDSIYTIEIEGVTITVRCAAWREWKARQLTGHPDARF